MGVIDSYDAVHSEFTGDNVKFHAERWPRVTHCRWRWSFDKSIYCVGEKLTLEQYDLVMAHLTKRFGLLWWENGHHDIDHFLAQMEKEQPPGKPR